MARRMSTVVHYVNTLAALLLVLSTSSALSKDSRILSKLLDGYDKEVRPLDGVKPLPVYADAVVDSIGVIEEASMICWLNICQQYTVYLYFRQYWTDERLAGKINKSLTLTGHSIGLLWKPDPYCYNARQSNLMAEDKDIRSRLTLNPDGSIFYSRWANILGSCFMELHDFPLDTQVCFLKFGSYSLGNTHLLYSWKKDNIQVLTKRMAQFDLSKVSLKTEVDQYLGENFTTIHIQFTLSRRVGYYIIQAYCPDILIVILSWIILWMDSRDMGDRMALGITTILTIMFLLGATNASMPKVSYPKALDWYLLVSFAFVFMTLVESMLVFLLTHKQNQDKPKTKKRGELCLSPYKRVATLFKLKDRKNPSHNGRSQSPSVPLDRMNNFIENEVHTDAEISSKQNDECWDKIVERDVSFSGQQSSHCGEKVDKASRILFPLAFLAFNLSYWYMYLYKGNQ